MATVLILSVSYSVTKTLCAFMFVSEGTLYVCVYVCDTCVASSSDYVTFFRTPIVKRNGILYLPHFSTTSSFQFFPDLFSSVMYEHLCLTFIIEFIFEFFIFSYPKLNANKLSVTFDLEGKSCS